MLYNEGKSTEVKRNIRRLFSIVFESLAKDYEIPRNKLLLETIIGQGQFGDVHRGTFVSPVSSRHSPPPPPLPFLTLLTLCTTLQTFYDSRKLSIPIPRRVIKNSKEGGSQKLITIFKGFHESKLGSLGERRYICTDQKK